MKKRCILLSAQIVLLFLSAVQLQGVQVLETEDFEVRRNHYPWHAWNTPACKSRVGWTAFWRRTAEESGLEVELNAFRRLQAGTVLRVPSCNVQREALVGRVDSLSAKVDSLEAFVSALEAKFSSDFQHERPDQVGIPFWLVMWLVLLTLFAVAVTIFLWQEQQARKELSQYVMPLEERQMNIRFINEYAIPHTLPPDLEHYSGRKQILLPRCEFHERGIYICIDGVDGPVHIASVNDVLRKSEEARRAVGVRLKAT